MMLFCAWCVLENVFIQYFIFEFMLFAIQRDDRRLLPVWLLCNGLLTLAVTLFQIPGTFPIEIVILFVFMKYAFRIPRSGLVAPIAIIFTLYTFAEGYKVFILSWVSSSFYSPTGGRLEQVLLSLVIDIFFFSILQMIKKRYFYTLRQSVSSYLYILLLPCTLLVWTLRHGLRLDSRGFERHMAALDGGDRSALFMVMFVALIIVFVMIEVFSKIIRLTEHEKSVALLQSQLNGQRIYMEEAKKRGGLYESFQHDVNNHLLVILGLLGDRRFAEAEEYVQKLQNRCGTLLAGVSTGKAALDVLLNEKLGYAKQNQIAVTWDVMIPEDFGIEDMDLCVVFSNILDNAIAACVEMPREERRLALTARVRAQFLVVEAVNTTCVSKEITYGTGLGNVRHIAEKYHGTLDTELDSGSFRVSVLLCAG